MKIHYTKKRFKNNLIFAIVWTVLGLLNLNYFGENNWMDFAFLATALLYWVSYFYERRNQYLSIENNTLTKHSIFPKTIKITDIKRILRFEGSYRIETSEKTLKINKDLIDAESLYKLDDYFKTLELEV